MSKQAPVCSNEPDKSMPMLRRSERLRAKRDSSSSELIGEPRAKKIKKMNNRTDEKSKDLINTLDHDCLAKIFKYFPISERLELEKVCTRWEMIIRGYAWDDIKKINFFDLKKHNYFENQAEVHEILLRCCRYLKELAVPENMSNSEIVSTIKDNCHNLTKLRITLGEDINGYDFMKACTAMKNLKSVDIDVEERWFGPRNPLLQKNHILDNLPDDINEILLSFRDYYPLQRLSLIPDKLSNLQCLGLSYCKLDSGTVEGISQLKTLVDLRIVHCCLGESSQRFVLRFPNLERITLRNLRGFELSDGNIADSCKKIKYIDIYECDVSLGDLGKAEYLESLSLNSTGINDAAVVAIANQCRNLKSFELFYEHDGDSTDHLRELKKMTSLEHLDVGTIYPMTDSSFISVITNHCKKLKSFKLCCYYEWEDDVFKELGKLEHLEYLLLLKTRTLNEDIICYIMQKCKQLKHFEFGFEGPLCSISESGLKKMPISENLEYLDFGHSSIINNKLILYVTKKYKNLKSLNLMYCDKMSNPNIKMILENCPQLDVLNFMGIPIKLKTLITAANVTKYRKSQIVLTIIHNEFCVGEAYKRSGISSPYLRVVYE